MLNIELLGSGLGGCHVGQTSRSGAAEGWMCGRERFMAESISLPRVAGPSKVSRGQARCPVASLAAPAR